MTEPSHAIEPAKLSALVERHDADELWKNLRLDWRTGSVDRSSHLAMSLVDVGLADISDDGVKLNRKGILFAARLMLPIHTLLEDADSELRVGSYVLKELLSTGKNSAIYSAEHVILRSKAVVKLLRPGASEDIVSSLRHLGVADIHPAVVRPIDFGELEVADIFGSSAQVHCLVFPMVDGVHFSDFVSQNSSFLNSFVVISFIRQVGGALRSLEQAGAYHGDLHERNILVDWSPKGTLSFRIVDVSYDSMGSASLEVCRNDDLVRFRQHILKLLAEQSRHLPRMSLRKYLGTRFYTAIAKILSPETKSFDRVLAIAEDVGPANEYTVERMRFIEQRFGTPGSFRLQRFEEIVDPAVAIKLFVPFQELKERIEVFGNVYVSGNRGSGKSTYLASLAYFPTVPDINRSFTTSFGIYFPCRQGEFASLSAHGYMSDEDLRIRTTHVLIVKVIRRTIESLAGGLNLGNMRVISDLGPIVEFLNRFIAGQGMVAVDGDIIPELESLVSSITRLELQLMSTFRSDQSSISAYATPRDLIDFFNIVQQCFSEVAATQFHILFDDAGTPYMPGNVQRAVCDLMLASNSVFCVKLTAEKFTFVFQSSSGKVLENGNDYVEQDISAILFIGANSAGLTRHRLEEYFRKIVEQRLVHFGYQSTDIVDYLGDSPNVAQRLIGLLAAGRKDAYYAGWTTVWNVADRTPRHLLEIVSEIFAVGAIKPDTPPRQVTMRDQDRAVRTISEKRLHSLSQIAGSMLLAGKTVSLGRQIFEVTVTIGATFRSYLRSELGKERKRQHLALERNDLTELLPAAHHVLERLISFGILDDAKLQYSRDDQVKKPVYVLNRIYCPAFGISFVRDEHLRLSRGKMEMLLLNPQLFNREGTTRLRALPENQRNLFSDLFD
jgi:serine/threonine protein kinase